MRGGELAQFVVHERQQVGRGRRLPAATASRRRVTSDMTAEFIHYLAA
jgi:hypothetical protein